MAGMKGDTMTTDPQATLSRAAEERAVESGITFDITLLITGEEMRRWPPEQITRFFSGVAMAAAAVREARAALEPRP